MPCRSRTTSLSSGGRRAGLKPPPGRAASTKSAKITIIEQRDNLSTATCGLPYFLAGVVKERDLISRQADYFRNVFDMTVLTGTKALAINRKAHSVEIVEIKDG